jgi:hypothetical protein
VQNLPAVAFFIALSKFSPDRGVLASVRLVGEPGPHYPSALVTALASLRRRLLQPAQGSTRAECLRPKEIRWTVLAFGLLPLISFAAFF